MPRLSILLSLSLLVLAGPSAADDRYSDDYGDRSGHDGGSRRFDCESNGNRTVYCSVDRGTDVRFVRQNSRAACIEGQSWGWDRGGVWVSGGCRAEFEVVDQRSNWGSGWGDNRWNDDGYDRGSPRNGLVRCESNGARGGYCRADTSRGVRLANQMSSAQCVEGQSWGYDRSGIWVSHGCRAEFLLAGSGQGGWNSNEGGYGDGGRNSGTVTCESQDGRYVFCRTGRVRQVQLQRQLSRGACVQNETWGYRADGIWVSNGCRGEFSLY